MAVVDSTTLEAVNLMVGAEDTTIRREAAAVVAAGKPILDEIPTRPTFLRTDIHRAEGQTVLQTILTDGSGQERMGGKTLVAGLLDLDSSMRPHIWIRLGAEAFCLFFRTWKFFL